MTFRCRCRNFDAISCNAYFKAFLFINTFCRCNVFLFLLSSTVDPDMESRPLADQNCPPKRNRDASHVNVASASPARLNGGSQNGAASAAAAAVSSHHPPRGCLLPAPLTVSSASLTAVDRLPAAPVPHVTQSNDNFKPYVLNALLL